MFGTYAEVLVPMRRRFSSAVLAEAVVDVRLTFPCPPTFLRGDVDGSGRVNLRDYRVLAKYLLRSGAAPSCLKSADVNDNGRLGKDDVIHLLYYLYGRGPAPIAPFPFCGIDRTRDKLTCEEPTCADSVKRSR